jgi:hypothetical protein
MRRSVLEMLADKSITIMPSIHPPTYRTTTAARVLLFHARYNNNMYQRINESWS